jgi:hypothetical protein
MADTPDTVVETVPEVPAPAPVAAPERQGSALMPVLGGVVAAVIGFGVAQMVPDLFPKADVTALETRLAAWWICSRPAGKAGRGRGRWK